MRAFPQFSDQLSSWFKRATDNASAFSQMTANKSLTGLFTEEGNGAVVARRRAANMANSLSVIDTGSRWVCSGNVLG